MRGNRVCGSLVPKAYLTRGGNWDIPPPHPQLNFPSGDDGRVREEELGRGPGGQQSAVRGRAVLGGELRRTASRALGLQDDAGQHVLEAASAPGASCSGASCLQLDV